MGGAKAIAEALSKRAKSAKSAQIITWVAGLLVFFDDYANSLIIGPMMRPVTDKMKISRERLAFIIDATAAPVAGIAIISTWIGLEVGLIGSAFDSIGVDANPFGVFLSTIPFRFYNILILGFIVITALLLKDFGPMRKAELECRKGSSNISSNEDANKELSKHDDMEPLPGVKLSIWNAIIPIGALIVGALFAFYYSGYTTIMVGEDSAVIQIMKNSPASFDAIKEAFSNADASVALFQSALFAGIVAMVMGAFKKIFTLSVLGAIISFATGTSYGTMGILMPLAIPLSYSINPEISYIIVATSAVLTGAIFGDHCSPISDTTILSSMGAGCNHIDHVRTQMPYSIFVAVITIVFGYIPAGFGLPVYLVLPLAFVAMFIGIQIFGKSVEVEDINGKEVLDN